MCERAVDKSSCLLEDVPDHFKTREMCAVSKDPYYLQFVPDWFGTQEQVKTWYEEDDDDDEIVEWFEAYKKRKALKKQIGIHQDGRIYVYQRMIKKDRKVME